MPENGWRSIALKRFREGKYPHRAAGKHDVLLERPLPASEKSFWQTQDLTVQEREAKARGASNIAADRCVRNSLLPSLEVCMRWVGLSWDDVTKNESRGEHGEKGRVFARRRASEDRSLVDEVDWDES